MSDRLQGKTALVTGATSGLGRAIATAMAAEGAHVVVTGRSLERGEQVVRELREHGGRADFAQADLDGRPATATALSERATELLGGRVDVLVNNAGIYPPDSTPGTDEARFDEVVGVNLKAPFFLTAALAPAMAARGDGVILNLGSWIARLGVPSGALYSATKGALETLTRAWSAEFGPSGVRVNAISPGVMAIEGQPPAEHPAAAMMATAPAGLPGDPSAVADAAVWLASDGARFVHGTVVDVDGGRASVWLPAA